MVRFVFDDEMLELVFSQIIFYSVEVFADEIDG